MAFSLKTRNEYTNVDAEIGFSVDGKELPTLGVLGAALEEAVALIQQKVAESYAVVPARI
jgi:hypothetical protein